MVRNSPVFPFTVPVFTRATFLVGDGLEIAFHFVIEQAQIPII